MLGMFPPCWSCQCLVWLAVELRPIFRSSDWLMVVVTCRVSKLKQGVTPVCFVSRQRRVVTPTCLVWRPRWGVRSTGSLVPPARQSRAGGDRSRRVLGSPRLNYNKNTSIGGFTDMYINTKDKYIRNKDIK